MTTETKTYVLSLSNNRQKRITVPANWKVTFGPLVPGGRYEGGQGLALRFYASKDDQRAVFTKVEEFRDTSIPILERVTKTQKRRSQKDTPEGKKDFIVEARITEWNDPDAPDELPADEFLSLPDGNDEAPF